MKTIFVKLVIFFFFSLTQKFAVSDHNDDGHVYYNGFKEHFLKLDGSAQVDADTGLLRLTDLQKDFEQGRAFYSLPFLFKGNFSFSTTFVFAIASEYGPNLLSGQGMAFVIAPQRGLPGALANQFLGLFNDTNNGKTENRVFAVELDGANNVEFDTVPGPHVGIDINSLKSVNSTDPGYFTDGVYKHLNLTSTEPMQVWVDYDGIAKQVSVTLAPINISKPNVPLLLWSQDLSAIFLDSMYVGFAAATQATRTYHYILGWSFQIDGTARALNLSSLPKLPPPPSFTPPSPPPPPPPPPPNSSSNNNPNMVIIASAVGGSVLILALLVIFGFCYLRKPKENNVPVRESSPPPLAGLRKFKYNELEEATNVFTEQIGEGAFENLLLSTADKKLGGEYAEEEMVLVLKLGLLCCRFDPNARPTVQKILQFLSGDSAEADFCALQMSDEVPVRHVGGGSTSPLSGTHVGSTSSGNDPTTSRHSGSPSSVNEASPSVMRNAFTR
ncbi:hypothetical protein MKW92_030124 [Papaver armeniacum]|nr:hypothetical protein MKW92_030124 [Papaver armeniacum]